MANPNNRYKPRIKFVSDGLEARLVFPVPDSNAEPQYYTRDSLKSILNDYGVTFGIKLDVLQEIAEHPIYDTEITVATGRESTPGTEGYYEFFFERDLSKKPTIRPDGSTDYMNIKTIEIVNEGDQIALYHPAVQGAAGMNVRGIAVQPKPMRELPPLIGRGFTRERDGVTYTAAISGKIDLTGENKVFISPVYEINADASIETGNIDFNGDVIVHGGAHDGVKIKATGNITIDGLVENCEIYAGKDLVLKSGVKGGEIAKISAEGNITAEFIEYATVECGGDFTGDVIFKSRIMCNGALILNGKKSSIIGGYTASVGGIEVSNMGNDFGTVTDVAVGVDPERYATIENLRRTIMSLSDNVEKISAGIAEFDLMGKQSGVDYKDDPRRGQLLRVKIRDERVIAESKVRLERLEKSIENAKDARIRVLGTAYAGCNIMIDNHRTSLLDYHSHIEFIKTLEGIRMDRLDGVI